MMTLVALLVAASAPAATRYVAPNGFHVAPFTNWVEAATNLGDAVEAAQDGDVILVTNGYYEFTQQLAVRKGLDIRSVNGAAATTLDGTETNANIFLDHRMATLDGFTVTRCRGYSGGGIFVGGGVEISHCIVTGNWAYVGGGGIHCDRDGVVRDCVIRDNTAVRDADGGGMTVLLGGLAENCVIVSNHARVGGGVMLDFHSALVNCLVAGNTARQAGGVLVAQDSRVLNCTIADNTADAAGGVDLFFGGELVNSIVYHNTAARGSNLLLHASAENGGTVRYSCTAPDAAGMGNLSADPLFLDRALGDYRLATNSPCLDAGTDAGAPTNDLAGVGRPLDGDGDTIAHTDMGAYEASP